MGTFMTDRGGRSFTTKVVCSPRCVLGDLVLRGCCHRLVARMGGYDFGPREFFAEQIYLGTPKSIFGAKN